MWKLLAGSSLSVGDITEVDKDYKGPIRIMHWTGRKGKLAIQEKKWD